MHQLLAYADDVTIMGESVHIVKENAEALEYLLLRRLG
jgi:hypothetical protein